MRKIFLILLLAGLTSLAPTHASEAATVDPILAANQHATGASAWTDKATLQINYSYAGQGLTGTSSTLVDLRRGAFVDSYRIGPTSGANGFDGEQAWEREPSGTVAAQSGGDVLPLAVNEAYRDRNLWWQPDRGGAQIDSAGQRTADGRRYDVLNVTPKDGKPFEAWFDTGTHLLVRTVELQGTLTITTLYSDYAGVDGVQLAHKLAIDDGSGLANRQTMTLTSARFLPARAAAAYAKPGNDLHDYTLTGGVNETTVPFQLVNNHIYVQASINGSKPLTFIVDTGGHDILTPAIAKLMGVRSQGSQTSSGAGDSVTQSGVARVESIAVGVATLRDQPVTVLQFSNAAEGIDEQGMIGYEFFARFITRIDYGTHRISFIDKRHFDPKDAGTPVRFGFFHQFPEVLGSYDGIPGRFGIDTGSRGALTLTRPFAERNHLREHEPHGIEALTGWGVGGPSRGFVFRGKDLKLDGVTVTAPLAEFSTDKGGAGGVDSFPNNIGGGVLKRFVVTLDYDHQLIYLKPIPGKIDDLDTFDRSGMWINQLAQDFEIVDVNKGGPAEAAGLHIGDVITAVDGKPAGSIQLPELRQRLRNEASSTTVTMTVIHGSTARAVKIVLREQI